MCHRDFINVHQEGEKRCELCKRLNIQRCYCCPFYDEDYLNKCKETLEAYVARAQDLAFEKFDDIVRESEILIGKVQADRTTNKMQAVGII